MAQKKGQANAIQAPAEIGDDQDGDEGGFPEHQELFQNFNMPDITAPDDMPIPPDEEDLRKAEKGSVEGSTGEPQGNSDLEARLQKLEQEREEERKRYEQQLQTQQQTIDRLIQGVAPGQAAGQMTQTQQQQMAEDFDLPDPVEKPKEFAKALADIIRTQTKQATSQVTQQQSREQQLAQVRDKFWRDNADLSDVPELVDAAYQKEAQRLQQAGVDPMNAALSDPDGLSSRVAQAARERARQLGLTLGQGQSQQAETPAPAPAAQTQKPTGRTAGVSAGTVPSTPKSSQAGNDPGMVEEVKRFQRESGFF